MAFEPGVCSVCGCSEDEPCPDGCIWANATATLCSRCASSSDLQRLLETPDSFPDVEGIEFEDLEDLDQVLGHLD